MRWNFWEQNYWKELWDYQLALRYGPGGRKSGKLVIAGLDDQLFSLAPNVLSQRCKPLSSLVGSFGSSLARDLV